MWCESKAALVTNCTLVGNSAFSSGGGAAYGTLNNCTLRGNCAFSDGGGAFECVLNNCTISGNSAVNYGGGASSSGVVDSSTLNNCVVQGNSAPYGGGADYSTFNNCTIMGNLAYSDGGGACNATLNNCTITGNSAGGSGGGASSGTLNNCIVYYNSATVEGANFFEATLNYCCTSPMPAGGSNNITSEPLFVNLAGGDLHLQPTSPCINAGLNASAPGPVDLDGNPRIVGGTVDMGAYEWAGLPPSPPQFVSVQPPGADGMTLTLSGDIGGVVEIHASTNLMDWLWLARLTNISGQVIYVDSDATNQPVRFYRAVQLP